MIVQIKMLQPADEVKEHLERGGWRIVEEHAEGWNVRHRNVTTEADARQRLQELGLLTSAQLRIRFVKVRPRRQLVPG